MRCSLGARGENATRGKVFAMARGTRVRGGVFSDTTGRRGMAFLRTRWAGGGTAFLRHSLRWKHGRWAYLCFRALSPASCGKGEPVRRALFLRVARGRGGTIRSRQERRRFFGLMETDAPTGAFFLGVTREGGVSAEGVVRRWAALSLRAARGRGGRCRQAASGAAAWRRCFFRLDEDRRSNRGFFPRHHAGRGSGCRRRALSLRGAWGKGRQAASGGGVGVPCG